MVAIGAQAFPRSSHCTNQEKKNRKSFEISNDLNRELACFLLAIFLTNLVMNASPFDESQKPCGEVLGMKIQNLFVCLTEEGTLPCL
ncbi:hypothetical protein [Lampropedia cohaerens]|uniref:hypothetical protein n=1 Tax=Lampropedia cohaerens TaxID=1610491 RepID=UPI0018D205E8|nr:hypothetical protein [Lampropedia cohaerens]